MAQSLKARRLTFCVLVFSAVYPLVTALAYLMQAAARSWEIWQRHLVVVPIIVLAMVFLIIPVIERLLAQLDDHARSRLARSSPKGR